MVNLIQFRRDTAANWTSNNPVLLEGEPGVETDTLKYKIGDGVTHWTTLAYAGVTENNPGQFCTLIATIYAMTTNNAPYTQGQVINFGVAYESINPITTFTWDFGDSTPQATGPTVAHTYSATGVKTVTCTLTDSENNSAITRYSLNVLTGASANIGQVSMKVDAPMVAASHSITMSNETSGVMDTSKTIGQTIDLPMAGASHLVCATNDVGIPSPYVVGQFIDAPLSNGAINLVIVNADGFDSSYKCASIMDSPISGATHGITFVNNV